MDQSLDFKEKDQDMEGLRAGRRIIGQVAGQEINYEIEGRVSRIKKKKKKFFLSLSRRVPASLIVYAKNCIL